MHMIEPDAEDVHETSEGASRVCMMGAQ